VLPISGPVEIVILRLQNGGFLLTASSEFARGAAACPLMTRLMGETVLTRDTLSWSLVAVPDSHRWGICGYSREGPDFVRVEYLGQTARCLNGASVAGIRRLADSVAATHWPP